MRRLAATDASPAIPGIDTQYAQAICRGCAGAGRRSPRHRSDRRTTPTPYYALPICTSGTQPTRAPGTHPESCPRKHSPLLRLNPRKYELQVKPHPNTTPKRSRKASPLTGIGLLLRIRSTAAPGSRKASPIRLTVKINNNFIHLVQTHRVPLEITRSRKASPW
jgi:hypothetical protein